jgi:hypothetical protein
MRVNDVHNTSRLGAIEITVSSRMMTTEFDPFPEVPGRFRLTDAFVSELSDELLLEELPLLEVLLEPTGEIGVMGLIPLGTGDCTVGLFGVGVSGGVGAVGPAAAALAPNKRAPAIHAPTTAAVTRSRRRAT